MKNGVMEYWSNGVLDNALLAPVTIAHSPRTHAIHVIPIRSLPPRRGKIKIGVPVKNQITPSFILPR